VELKLKWSLGERVVMNMDMKQNIGNDHAQPARSMKQDMTLGQKYGLTSVKGNPDGGHEVEMNISAPGWRWKWGAKSCWIMIRTKNRDRQGESDGRADGRYVRKIIGAKIQYS